MPKPCSVCAHMERAALDRRLVLPVVNVAELAREYGVSRDALRRHRDRHLLPMMRTFAREQEALSMGAIRGELVMLYERALDALARAEAGVLIGLDDSGVAIRKVSPTAIQGAIREARLTVESLAKLAEREHEVESVTAPALSEAITRALERVAQRQALPGATSDNLSDAEVIAGNVTHEPPHEHDEGAEA